MQRVNMGPVGLVHRGGEGRQRTLNAGPPGIRQRWGSHDWPGALCGKMRQIRDTWGFNPPGTAFVLTAG